VTLAELLVEPLIASTDGERAARQAHLQQAEADFVPLPFDAPAAQVFGRVAASLRRVGRKVNARAYDAMIAATAVANGAAPTLHHLGAPRFAIAPGTTTSHSRAGQRLSTTPE
jgi:predicted nucleic acid-binding protein